MKGYYNFKEFSDHVNFSSPDYGIKMLIVLYFVYTEVSQVIFFQ